MRGWMLPPPSYSWSRRPLHPVYSASHFDLHIGTFDQQDKPMSLPALSRRSLSCSVNLTLLSLGCLQWKAPIDPASPGGTAGATEGGWRKERKRRQGVRCWCSPLKGVTTGVTTYPNDSTLWFFKKKFYGFGNKKHWIQLTIINTISIVIYRSWEYSFCLAILILQALFKTLAFLPYKWFVTLAHLAGFHVSLV